MDNTIIQQGSFTSTGAAVTIPLRSGVDWMRVYNYTQAGNGSGSGVGYEFYWQYGMADGSAIEWLQTSGASSVTTLSSGGFTYVDSSLNALGAAHSTITAISTASIPVVTNTGTNGIAAGDVVYLSRDRKSVV